MIFRDSLTILFWDKDLHPPRKVVYAQLVGIHYQLQVLIAGRFQLELRDFWLSGSKSLSRDVHRFLVFVNTHVQQDCSNKCHFPYREFVCEVRPAIDRVEIEEKA